MKYKVSVIKKIAFLVMTMALAGAMVACKGAVGPAGPPGPPAETPTTPPPTTPPPTTPPPTTPGNPTYAGVSSLSVAVGLEVPIDLSAAFSDPDGDTLTFSDAASSDTAVATVALSGSTLTITAVAAGTSTISVTATDPGGLSVTGSVMLTVSEPPTTTLTLPLSTMKIGDDPVIIELGANERFTSSAQRIVSVEQGIGDNANKWTIRAEAKGTATITHIGADGQRIASVDVTVPNQAPMRTDHPNPRTSLYYELIDASLDADSATDMMHADYGLSRTDFFLDPYFTDPDGDALKYTFSSQSPEVLFVKATNTANDVCCTVFVDVLSETHESASIVVHASDSGGLEAIGTVEFQVGVLDPEVLPRKYTTHQQIDGDLATVVRVELRKQELHTLEFVEVTQDSAVVHGFKFALDFLEKLIADKQIGSTTVTTNYVGEEQTSDNKVPAEDGTEGVGVFTISARDGDPVKVGVDSLSSIGTTDAVPSLTFELTGAGSAVVTVSYHVWDNDMDGDTDTMDDGDWRTASETVNIEISTVPEYAGAGEKYPK